MDTFSTGTLRTSATILHALLLVPMPDSVISHSMMAVDALRLPTKSGTILTMASVLSSLISAFPMTPMPTPLALVPFTHVGTFQPFHLPAHPKRSAAFCMASGKNREERLCHHRPSRQINRSPGAI